MRLHVRIGAGTPAGFSGMVVAACLLLSGPARSTMAQVRVENLTTSMGVATEMYGSRDFSAITVPQIDSTESALAGVGHMGLRGSLIVQTALDCDFDGGMRQFVTSGFRLRNYAPRELSGRIHCDYRYQLGEGRRITFRPTVDVRHVADRPPLPIYLPPGYRSGSVVIGYNHMLGANIDLYGRVLGEIRDFAKPVALPALDLLDRDELSLQMGAVKRFPNRTDSWDRTEVELLGAYRRLAYPKQGLGLLRRDNVLQLAGRVTLSRPEMRGFLLTMALSGIRSRSNSRRVEYNAATVDAEIRFDLGDVNFVNLVGSWKAKRYTTPQQVLVPGEEADNGSRIVAGITRVLDNGVRAAIEGGWSRAETIVSGAYYERFSLSFNLAVTP